MEESRDDKKVENDPPTGEITSGQRLQSRAYQIEMFEQSMLQNIIITMDTGSGKTQIAKLRIEAELERFPQKRVWFCAPNVVLAQQQHTFLSSQLPAYQTRLITGLDNVQFWSDQSVWDTVLESINIVVSTPQVLLDALSHGFVSLQEMCLLVFDEAHHCVSNAPMAAIMRRFYHPARESASDVPHILGMTASPITNKAASLRELEANMNAVCKAPTLQVEEYRQHVYLPKLERLTFRTLPSKSSAALKALEKICALLRVEDDPAVVWLQRRSDIHARQKLAKITSDGRTPIMKQMRAFLGHATHICNELGPWSADLYIKTCVQKLQESAALHNSLSLIQNLAAQEQQYMCARLQPLRGATSYTSDEPLNPSDIAPKTMAVLKYLLEEYRPGITSIVFVKRRSIAYSLTQLMQAFFDGEHYKVFSFVGSANAANRALMDLADMQIQKEAFADFRAGERNVCVATQVMEEGVDVQAINLVIRFDEPETFRSFIQSRGRARHSDSKFVMVHALEDTDSVEKVVRWKELEKALKTRYADIMRHIREAEDQENQREDGNEFYRVSASGALLSYDNARQHLDYFYHTLPQAQDLESTQVPIIISKGLNGVTSARVILPSSMPPSLQATNSIRTWRTEKKAKQDAAFQTLKALHTAKLIDDNLMPLIKAQRNRFEIESRDSMYEVQGLVDVWALFARNLSESSQSQWHRIEVSGRDFTLPTMKLLLPLRLDTEMTFELQSASKGTVTVHITSDSDGGPLTSGLAEKITTYLLKTVLGRRLKALDTNDPLPFLLLPGDVKEDYQTWFDRVQRVTPLVDMTFNSSLARQSYLLRHRKEEILYKWSPSFEDQDVKHYSTQESIVAERLSKQLSFLEHRTESSSDARSVAVGDCSVQGLSPAHAEFMLLVPSIQSMLGIRLRGQLATQREPLCSVGFGNSSLVAKGLTSSEALSSYNFESMEFMGDTLLKYYASIQMYFDHPLFTVGALASKLSSLVNNARLQRATREFGLDQYITTERFSGQGWTLKPTEDGAVRRTMSSKTLADIAEALVAAAYLDPNNSTESQDELPMKVISLLIPEVAWKSPKSHSSDFHRQATPPETQIMKFGDVEDMIGYKFKHTGLLAEALTHLSLRIGLRSYERLEFLGDAVLDRIVNVALYNSERRLDQEDMKDCQAALVNRWTLAFFVMNASYTIVVTDVQTTADGRTTFKEVPRTIRLVDHMRISGDRAELRKREKAEQTFLRAQSEVLEALDNQQTFPWTPLVSIDTSKPYSDIFESILGAVFIDSGASLSACEKVLDKLGLMKILKRMTTEASFECRQPFEVVSALYPELLKKETESGKWADGSKMWVCEIVRYNEVVAQFQSSTSAKHAEAGATEAALEVMTSRKRKCSELDVDSVAGQHLDQKLTRI